MQIAAADAAIEWADQDVIVFKRTGRRNVVEPDIFAIVKSDCAHGGLPIDLQPEMNPPSMMISVPVRYGTVPDSRNITVSAISCGSPYRPIGMTVP